VLTLTTGVLDAVTFLRLGKVFSSVITGNLALLGVAAGQLDAALALNAGLALGKLFTISLLALGVVALAAAIGAVTQLVAGGELGSWLRRRRMDTSLDRMSGHFIVCAYGRVGRAAVAQLRADRCPAW